ncbi:MULTISPECIES: hypothetical protein [Psychromonas]|uniref:Phage protein n=1 Tax=Psychromonas arctica TaxID=168275 RepID=A0ABU9HDP7_9GAMM|nr:hypothetical protein [Psychromonas sp. SP041]
MLKSSRENRIPVSTKKTGCVPFNIKQKASEGYKVGENPVKPVQNYTLGFNDSLVKLRTYKVAGWRDYGSGNSQSARKAIGWVTESDAKLLLAEMDDSKRVALYESIADVME